MGPAPLRFQASYSWILLEALGNFVGLFAWMSISSVVPEGRITVSFSSLFLSIVPGVKQELNQYLPIVDGNSGGSGVESRVNRSTGKVSS